MFNRYLIFLSSPKSFICSSAWKLYAKWVVCICRYSWKIVVQKSCQRFVSLEKQAKKLETSSVFHTKRTGGKKKSDSLIQYFVFVVFWSNQHWSLETLWNHNMNPTGKVGWGKFHSRCAGDRRLHFRTNVSCLLQEMIIRPVYLKWHWICLHTNQHTEKFPKCPCCSYQKLFIVVFWQTLVSL